MKKYFTVGLVFLLFQIVSVIYAKTIHERFFCWAPFDQHSYYETSVIINNKELSVAEIEKRYRYRPKGWEPRSIYNVFSIINQYESTYGKQDNASVKVTYSINGHKEQLWVLKQ